MDWLGKCFCPICEQALPGRLLVDDHVWLTRRCPEHGLIKTMLFESPSYFGKAMAMSRTTGRQPRCLVIELTERCDQGCITCSASSTVMGAEETAEALIDRTFLQATALNADVVALSGGEPLMRPDVWEIADTLHTKIPKIVLITSGRRLESDPAILRHIRARAEWLELYLQFDSLRDNVLHSLRSVAVTSELRRRRLGLALDTGAAVSAVCVVPPNIPETDIGELTVFLREQGAAGVTFQPLRRLGRHPVITAASSRLGTVDFIQKMALEALSAGPDEAFPFAPQPYDISVSVVTGSAAANAGRFFWSGRVKGFRVATASYWDYTNYFEPLASCGRYYFYMGGQSLNARYFSPGNQSNARRSVLATTG
jgi:uncharacterized radical SAM superfamily Fe-S cluster-containing enzyme